MQVYSEILYLGKIRGIELVSVLTIRHVTCYYEQGVHYTETFLEIEPIAVVA